MAQLFTKDQFANAYAAAPRAVRNSIQSKNTVAVIQSIKDNYHLHVDTISSISGQIGYMLLGLLTPNDFYKNLQGAGIDPKDATAITQEINTRIFLPLQQRIRDKVEEPEEEEEPEAVYDPSFEEVAEPARPNPQPPQVPVMSVRAPAAPQQASQPTAPPAYNLIQPGAVSHLPVPAPAPTTATPFMRTMQHDVAMIEQGHFPDPYPVQQGIAATPHPSQTTPARAFQTASVPFTSVYAPLQPELVPSKPVAELPREAPQQVTPPTLPSMTGSGGDPYRESI